MACSSLTNQLPWKEDVRKQMRLKTPFWNSDRFHWSGGYGWSIPFFVATSKDKKKRPLPFPLKWKKRLLLNHQWPSLADTRWKGCRSVHVFHKEDGYTEVTL